MSGELPAGWAWSNLEDTCTAASGGTPSKAEPTFWDDGTIPWVSPKDMKTRVITSSEDRVTEAALQRLTLIPTASLLLVVRSGILSRTLPVAVTALPVTVNQDMRAFTPRPDMSPDFLAWQLIGKERDVLAATSKDGTTVASIEAPALANFPLAVAPAAEQVRIVEKLEELLSDLDDGVAELKAAQKKLQQYRQSLLKAAVEGSLTAAWREANPQPAETGADLLARILRERRARWEAQQLAKFEAQGKTPPKGWQGQYAEPEPPATDGLPSLPFGWVWASVEQIGEVTTGFTPATSNPANFGGLIPFLKPTDLDAGYQVTGGREALTEEGARAGRVLPARSVLVTCIGATIGKVGFARIDCATNQQINAVSPEAHGVLPEFIYWALCSGFGQSQIIGNASATTLPILNKSKFSRLPVMVPPADEQREIVQRLEAQFGAASSLQAAQQAALRQSTAQRQNLLRAAFAGQLVPQDPTDEPAAELLARIRAERAQAPGKARKARGAAGREAA